MYSQQAKVKDFWNPQIRKAQGEDNLEESQVPQTQSFLSIYHSKNKLNKPYPSLTQAQRLQKA